MAPPSSSSPLQAGQEAKGGSSDARPPLTSSSSRTSVKSVTPKLSSQSTLTPRQAASSPSLSSKWSSEELEKAADIRASSPGVRATASGSPKPSGSSSKTLASPLTSRTSREPIETAEDEEADVHRKLSFSRTTDGAWTNLHRSSSTAGIFDLDTDVAEPSSSATTTTSPLASRTSPTSLRSSQPRPPPSSFIDPFAAGPRGQRIHGRTSPLDARRQQSTLAIPPPTAMSSAAAALSSSTSSSLSSSSSSGPIAIATAAGKHGKLPFDTTPSFSSPLAYASILPNDAADDFDLDRVSPSDGGDAREVESSLQSFGVAASRGDTSRKASAESTNQRRASNESQGTNANTSSGSVRRRSSGRTSAMGPPTSIPSRRHQPSSSSSSAASTSPDDVIPSHPSLVRSLKAQGKQREDAATARSISGSFSAVGSPVSSASQASTSPSVMWEQRPLKTPISVSAAGQQHETRTASGTSRRRKSSVQGLTGGGAHRRARSLGGALMIGGFEPGSSASSPIGGPDGVDPNLVAAIRGGDADPAASTAAPASSSASSLGSPPVSTPYGSVKRRSGLLNLVPGIGAATPEGTRPRAPSVTSTDSGKPASQRDVEEPSSPVSPISSRSPDDALPPAGYTRSRTRSQTIGTSPRGTNASLSASIGPGTSRSAREAAGLGDAIRLQRVPTSVRLAGDVLATYSQTQAQRQRSTTTDGAGKVMQSPQTSTSGVFAAPRSSIGSFSAEPASQVPPTPTGMGLGIGQQDSSPLLPATPSTSRRPSPRPSQLNLASSSRTTSGRNSPTDLDTGAGARFLAPPRRDLSDSTMSISGISGISGISATSYGAASASESASGLPPRDEQLYSTRRRSASPEQRLRASTIGPTAGSAYAALLSVSPSLPRANISGHRNSGEALRINTGAEHLDVGKSESASGSPHRSPLRARGGGRLSFAPGSLSSGNALLSPGEARSTAAQEGTDEYAQVILQSRNIKMQKWRASGALLADDSMIDDPDESVRELQRLGGGGGTSLGRRGTTLGLPDRFRTYRDARADESLDVDDSRSAFPSLGGESAGEIEWVDWLDEYRKMKEAKLQSEREEQREAGGDDEQVSSGPSTGVPSSVKEGSRTGSSPRPFPSQPSSSRPSSPKQSSSSPPPPHPLLSASSSTTTMAASAPRRPSEAPLHYQPSRSTFNTLSSSQSSSPLRPPSQKPLRNLSLSPMSSRFAQAHAQLSTSGASSSSSRRRNLGNKIETWWSTVKTGLAGSLQSPPATQRASSSGSKGFGGSASPRHASFSSVALKPRPAGAPPSAAARIKGAPTAMTSTSESSATLTGGPPSKPSLQTLREPRSQQQSAARESERSPSLDSGSSVGGTTASRRRQPLLSLNLEKGTSSFDAREFEGIGNAIHTGKSSNSGARTSSPLSQGPSPRQILQPLPTPVEEGTEDRLGEAFRSQLSSPKQRADGRPMLPGRTSSENRAVAQGAATSKDMTIRSIRHHIRHRLAASKESCDKELRKIVRAVNTFVESSLQEQQQQQQHHEAESDVDDGDIDLLGEGLQGLQLEEESPANTSTLRPSLMRRSTSGSSGGRAPVTSPPPPLPDPDETPRPHDDAHDDGAIDSPPHSVLADRAVGPQSVPLSMSSSFPGLRVAARTRDASRSISTSRSTSRSHSPMPPLRGMDSPRFSPARRLRRLPAGDPPLEPFVPALQDLVGIALDVADMPIAALTSHPGACSEIIANVQSVGKAWDDHPDWPGRGWFVQLLLAVAGLSRVVEWWEAEKGFWNFDDEGEEDAEPISFGFGQSTYDSTGSPAKGRIPRAPSTRASSVTSSPALEPKDRRVFSEPERGPSRLALAAAAAEEADESMATAATTAATTAAGTVINTSVDAAQRPLGLDQQNVLMELSLDQERLIYVSPAWRDVVGSDPELLLDSPIADLLAPTDSDTFAEATRQLQLNESHTVEIAFRMAVGGESLDANLYQEMEGKGMLMRDRQEGLPSHTMWVFKPVGSPEPEAELSSSPHAPQAAIAAAGITAASISTEPILCRICERDVPAWFFEKHSEICNEIHRLEMEVGECNEGLAELRRTIRAIVTALDEGEGGEEGPPQYRGARLTTPAASSEPPSALEHLQKSLTPRQPAPAVVRKSHFRALEALLDILLVAKDISTPSIKEDDVADPVDKQRLLSPMSEGRIAQVRAWKPPAVEDPAIEILIADVQTAIRNKLSVVNRTLNTIVYVETVRLEWEERVDAALARSEEEGEAGSSGAEDGGSDEAVKAIESPAEGVAASSPVPMTEDEEDAAETSAILLERDDRDEVEDDDGGDPRATLSPGGTADVDEIPGVERLMGGRAREHAPAIPIPRQGEGAHAAPARPSPLGLEDAGASGLGITAPRSRHGSATYTPDGHMTASSILSGTGSSLRRVSHNHHHHRPSLALGTPTSPRIPPTAPSSRSTASSIKDFDIIKPISKGAFGSVYLCKKRTTGDIYAIKVLRKKDMITKNQVTNVKAERMILMTQTQSPFVVKLFFSFQSTDYLYLVMEYLPGGDCASLLKMLGGLDEEWSRRYIAEIVNGLEQLHAQGIVHRDLKPDNLLIDAKGHLKLTDFGLSKIGLLKRQTNPEQQRGAITPSGHYKSDSPATSGSGLARSSAAFSESSPTASSPMTPGSSVAPGGAASFYIDATASQQRTGAPEKIQPMPSAGGTIETLDAPSPNPRTPRAFVGTPDYLAPESILGIGVDDKAVDWWALGVILYEFLYGIPPFHAETPELVFKNIVGRAIDWEEDNDEISPTARDLMEKLMCYKAEDRLGSRGAQEVKAHPFFASIDWDKIVDEPGPFVPEVVNPESTDYFDLRGAQEFEHEYSEPAPSVKAFAKAIENRRRPGKGFKIAQGRFEREKTDQAMDDFGSFSYKNLPVLKQANDEVIRKLRTEASASATLSQSLDAPRKRSLSSKVATSALRAVSQTARPSSPTTSVSSQSSAPLRSRAATGASGVGWGSGGGWSGGSDVASPPGPSASVMDRRRSQLMGQNNDSTDSRGRTASVSTSDTSSAPAWTTLRRRPTAAGLLGSDGEQHPPSLPDTTHRSGSGTGSLIVDTRDATSPQCLVAEDNPISQRMLCQVLARLGCRTKTVRNGAEAVRLAMSDSKYAALFIDLTLPIVNGQDVARMVKSTRNANSNTPVVALVHHEGEAAPPALDVTGSVFDGCLTKPIEWADVRSMMPGLLAQHHAATASASASANASGNVSATGSGPNSGGATAIPSPPTAPRMVKQRTVSGRTVMTLATLASEDAGPSAAEHGVASPMGVESLASKLGVVSLGGGGQERDGGAAGSEAAVSETEE